MSTLLGHLKLIISFSSPPASTASEKCDGSPGLVVVVQIRSSRVLKNWYGCSVSEQGKVYLAKPFALDC